MQIAIGPLNQDFEVSQPFQTIGDRWLTRCELAGIGNHCVIAGEKLVVRREIIGKTGPADLFFSFDQDLDVDRQPSRYLEPGLDRFEVREHLALVVGRSPSIEVAVSNGRFERRRQPRLQWLGWLNVVVAVYQDGWLVGSAQPLGVDEGMPLGFDKISLEPHRRQIVTDEQRGAAGIKVVIRLCTDTGYPDQVLELFFEIVVMRREIRLDSIERHDPLPFLEAEAQPASIRRVRLSRVPV
jgi:hypothetical protein